VQELPNTSKVTAELIKNISAAVVGKDEIIRMMVVALISRGHVLLEDVPGVGKTLLAKSLAKSISGSFKRVQFTSDLLPSDITGVSIYNQKTSEFEYNEGPVFANVVLADEINRGTPRTQSSLLEAMEEQQVSVDGISRKLPVPFFVIGTQNPIESHGTFPLPDSQMDRFLLSLSVGYPDPDQEVEMLIRQSGHSLLDNVKTLISVSDLLALQNSVSAVSARKEIYEYIVRIISATRENQEILLGGSPRASVAMLNAAKGFAFTDSRDYVVPDDLKKVAPYVLAHRIMTYRKMSRRQLLELLEKIIAKVPVS